MVEHHTRTEQKINVSVLILVRHGTSEWNSLGLWTGLVDVDLDETGIADGKELASRINGLRIDRAYCSTLLRAKRTLSIILEELKIETCVVETETLNERNYGAFTGKNKWQIKEELGEERFQLIRRSWDIGPPGGESLQEVHSRVSPLLRSEIVPRLLDGQTVLVVAHGNSLRALAKDIEGLTEEEIAKKEVGIGEVLVYHLDSKGEFIFLELRGENPNKGNI